MHALKIFTPLLFVMMTILFMVMSAEAAAINPDSVACVTCPGGPVCPRCNIGSYCDENFCTCTARCKKGIPPK
ncbi:hypothetical protein BGZ83_004169 [Gryganskiella cystojenkinii]|nr:hypothetical protein BGZ83_004169 [Gryganskiella cystojenkinii]